LDGGGDSAAISAIWADDNAPRANADGDSCALIPPVATDPLIPITTDPDIEAGLGHYEVFRLGRDGPNEQRGSRKHRRGGRCGERDLGHGVFLSG